MSGESRGQAERRHGGADGDLRVLDLDGLDVSAAVDPAAEQLEGSLGKELPEGAASDVATGGVSVGEDRGQASDAFHGDSGSLAPPCRAESTVEDPVSMMRQVGRAG